MPKRPDTSETTPFPYSFPMSLDSSVPSKVSLHFSSALGCQSDTNSAAVHISVSPTLRRSIDPNHCDSNSNWTAAEPLHAIIKRLPNRVLVSPPMIPITMGTTRTFYWLGDFRSELTIQEICGVTRSQVLLKCSDGTILIVRDEWYGQDIGWGWTCRKRIFQLFSCFGRGGMEE